MSKRARYFFTLSLILNIVYATAEAATISLQPDTLDASTNATVVFDLAGNGFTNNVDGGDFTLTWDSTILSYSSINITNSQFDAVFINDTNVATGTLDSVFLASSVIGGIGPDFAIGEITFNVTGSAGSTTAVSLSDAFVGWVAPGAEPITVDYNDAFVQVVPIPAAVYLFGSGLVGLLGFAHRPR